jgi:glyoxylase-like metal-dependent hydrolase (beta-lactamase superfamily II)
MATILEPIRENIYGVVAPCGSVTVRALLVAGDRFTLLIDTLAGPADLDPVRDLVASQGRPLLLANSHADWDHWWGNAAFPDAPVFAHRLTRERQLKEGKRSLAAKQREDPATFGDVTLRPATVAFDGTLDLDIGGIHVQLTQLPGHTHDHIVAYIPERRLMFAADAAEDPIPLVTEGPAAPWAESLLVWAERATTVVPAHGPVSGPELLRRNARYLQGLVTDPKAGIRELDGAPAFYRKAHRKNLRRAMSSEA